MPDQSVHSAQANSPDSLAQSIAVPVLVWSAIQVGCLALSAARVPLWARVDHQVENDALILLAATQVAAGALLFQWLMRDLRAGLLNILIAITLDQLAGVLSESSRAQTINAVSMVTTWLAGLFLWAQAFESRTAQLLSTAIVLCLSIGIAGTLYLSAEFASNTIAMPTNVAWLVIWGVLVLGIVFRFSPKRA